MRELLGPYVMGALDLEEERAVRLHLTRCAACRDEERGLRETHERLAGVSIAASFAPPDLKPRVLDAVAQGGGHEPGARSSDAPWHHARPAYDEPGSASPASSGEGTTSTAETAGSTGPENANGSSGSDRSGGSGESSGSDARNGSDGNRSGRQPSDEERGSNG